MAQLTQRLEESGDEARSMMSQLQGLLAENEDLREQLDRAQEAGTPVGEGAKRVLPLSFNKIRVWRRLWRRSGGDTWTQTVGMGVHGEERGGGT